MEKAYFKLCCLSQCPELLVLILPGRKKTSSEEEECFVDPDYNFKRATGDGDSKTNLEMSIPDYSQRAEDHGSIIILVKQLKHKSFNLIFDRISRQEYVRIQEPQTGWQRGIWLKYKKNYNLENNDWGDFQAHRKVLGLICIEGELEQLSQYYEVLRKKYSNTLFDSRFAVFGLNPAIIPKENAPSIKSISKLNSTEINLLENNRKIQDSSNKLEKLDPKHLEKLFPQTLDEVPKLSASSSSNLQYIDDKSRDRSKITLKIEEQGYDTKLSPIEQNLESSPVSDSMIKSRTSQFLFYKSVDEDYKKLEKDLYELACSLFWVLESKRLDGRMYDKSLADRIQLPVMCAPFESKDVIFNENDNKSQRKKVLGRLKKHMGDLSLQASIPGEALTHYTAAIELLKYINRRSCIVVTCGRSENIENMDTEEMCVCCKELGSLSHLTTGKCFESKDSDRFFLSDYIHKLSIAGKARESMKLQASMLALDFTP
ncbi:Trafficking protein particle complex subunit 9 [Nymphon striatum]|nr:Trafficking protein particle complex subunit 9 [Nymphon striatum]